MKALLILLAASSPVSMPGWVDHIYNVRYSEGLMLDNKDSDIVVYVVWDDPKTWEESSKEVCASHEDIIRVVSTTLSSYLKADRSVLGARETLGSIECK